MKTHPSQRASLRRDVEVAKFALDRWSGASGQLDGAPCIVVDLGTATTIDVVKHGRDYMGGLILPGLRIAMEAAGIGAGDEVITTPFTFIASVNSIVATTASLSRACVPTR